MIDRDWKSPEAIAFFEREWQHAILQAKVTLATVAAGRAPRAATPPRRTRREQIVGLAARYRLPAIYQFREYAQLCGCSRRNSVIRRPPYQQYGVYTTQISKARNPPTFRCCSPPNSRR